MPYMTPLQRATESSRMPKSVMKTTVGGGCTAGGCARRELAIRSKAANHNTGVRTNFAAEVNAIRIKSIPPRKLAPLTVERCRLLREANDSTRSRARTQSSLPASIIGAARNQSETKTTQERASDVQRDSWKIPRPFPETRFRQSWHVDARRTAAGHSGVVRVRRPTCDF